MGLSSFSPYTLVVHVSSLSALFVSFIARILSTFTCPLPWEGLRRLEAQAIKLPLRQRPWVHQNLAALAARTLWRGNAWVKTQDLWDP